jgi:hypothetical protein
LKNRTADQKFFADSAVNEALAGQDGCDQNPDDKFLAVN